MNYEYRFFLLFNIIICIECLNIKSEMLNFYLHWEKQEHSCTRSVLLNEILKILLFIPYCQMRSWKYYCWQN